MSPAEQLAANKAELAKLQAENAALRAAVKAEISLKVSEKGAISVYGLGRFPVTLYREQMEKLLGMSDQIKAFITTNTATLKTKNVTTLAS